MTELENDVGNVGSGDTSSEPLDAMPTWPVSVWQNNNNNMN